MGRVFTNDRQSKTRRQKRRIRNSKGKYLKPGALAQLRNSRASASISCIDLAKKRVEVLNARQTGGEHSKIPQIKNIGIPQIKNIDNSPTPLSPIGFRLIPLVGPIEVYSQSNLHYTPRTPCAERYESGSTFESLPIDLLVKILCHLHHDQLRAVFHVSRRIRKAVVIARQFHFNFSTPDRTRQEMLNTMTPVPTDHWPFISKEGGKRMLIASPHTPKAPKHGPRPPSRLKFTEMRQIAAVLFQDSSFSSKCLVPSVLQNPPCKFLSSNRVLFNEEELCQAVAQNKLR